MVGWFTLLSDLDLSAPEVGLFDVFDAEVSVAFGVLLLFVPRRRLIVRAVRVRRRCGDKRTQGVEINKQRAPTTRSVWKKQVL